MFWVYIAVLGGFALGAIIFYPIGVKHGVMRCMEMSRLQSYKQMFNQVNMGENYGPNEKR
jgi:hypothetical protein